MKYETLKTVFLGFLVAASVFLTWSLMTFQIYSDKTLDNLDTPKTNYDVRQASEVIVPMKIIFHRNDGHYGTTNDSEIDRVMDELNDWKFYGIGESKTYKRNQINQTIQDANHLELLFPDLVPFDIYKGVIQFNDKQIPNGSFDRLVIDLSKGQQKVTTVYFINSQNNHVFSGSVSSNEFQSFAENIKSRAEYIPYAEYQINKNDTIFLPKGKIKELGYTYIWDGTDANVVEKYKKALFTNPDEIPKGQKDNFIEYTNGFSLLRADTMNGMLQFVNYGEETDRILPAKDILKSSIDFVNINGGWNNNFYYFKTNLESNTALFRYFKNGLPVFNSRGLAEISVNLGDLKVYMFERPYINLEKYLPFHPTEVELPAANTVIDYLKNESHIDMDSVDNIVLGYTLQYTNQKTLYFAPSWYYHINGQWLPYIPEDKKGERHGLE